MCAVWTMIFTIPMWLFVPESVVSNPEPKIGIVDSYKSLFRQIGELRRTSNHTFRFLVASAVYRDGLAGVFTFGGVIAASIYGFTFTQVMIFGIAANLVAGVSTIVSGRLDDRFGARHVILYSLGSLVVLGTAAFILKDAGAAAFWAVGLLLSTFVGPAQAASRSFLARVAPAGREGEIFGLYATTGRAASFLAPTAWAALIAATGDTAWGILGIVLVLGVGFLLMLGVGRLGR
jgi:UMF1 family MFS transporter